MSTLLTLENNVRVHLQEATQGLYFSTHIRKHIGDAYKNYVLVMLEEGEGYFEETTNLGFTSGVEAVSLASLTPPFFSLSALERRLSYGTKPLKRSERRYQENVVNSSGTGNAYLPDYKFRGTNLILEPPPKTTEAGSATTGLKLDYNYIPTFPDASSADGFSFDAGFPVIYEPMIELHATIGLLQDKETSGGVSDIGPFEKRLKEWEEKFFDSLERNETPDEVEYSGLDYSNPLG